MPRMILKTMQYKFAVFCLVLLVTLLQSRTSHAEVECQTATGKVARAMFTTNIVNREPVDRVLILENTVRELYFFTDLRQFEGQEITHRWEYDGKVVMEKSFAVKGPRWRVYSRTDLPAESTGRWTVLVLDGKGCALKAVVFEYIQQSADGPGSAIIGLPGTAQ